MPSPASCEHGGARPGDNGQATVELALSLPLLCLFLLAIVQLVVIVRDQLAVELAAREAARAASVAASPSDAALAAAERSVALRPLNVSTALSGDTVTVTVGHVTDTDIPLIGALIPDVTVTATVTMALEPP
ncbi:MAG TPA: TadE/TadG family type IV pilus assembly protein [Ilumatobacteraceae bacterium]|jgi:Flp pilus assembly protein TadG